MNDFFTLPTLACLVIGYLLGSIPFALVIGKVFYKTDVRNYGSGNLGGTNAGRVLGAKAGAAVIACDILKVVIAIAFSALISPNVSIWTGLAAAIGHCYPIFAHFKGGKAVATMFGFLLATSIFTFHNAWYLIVPLVVFLILLVLFKMVSLSSMCAAIASSLFITYMQWGHLSIIVASWMMSALILYRHRSNIRKIVHGEENKISWL